MRIQILALLGCFGLSMTSALWAQDGPTLVDQLLGEDRQGPSTAPKQEEKSEEGPEEQSKDAVIRVDEIPDDLKVPLSAKVKEPVTGLPGQWKTMEEVRAAHGDPFETKGPVGEPPITQWFYRDFVVYFEHDQVIHTVFKTQ